MSALLPPAIPIRASSQNAITERRLHNRESLKQLKRKLSDGSVDKGSERYIKLRINEIETEQDLLRLDREELGLEHTEKCLDSGRYQKACREINKRIVSLGEDLWRSKRDLRSLEEQTEKIGLLTIDSKTAFAAALLRLYKDPLVKKNRSHQDQSTMRKDSIEVYNASKMEGGYLWLRCTLSNEYHLPEDVVTAHIVPARLGPELVDYIFGEGMGSRLFRSENSILMHRHLEQAFDNANIILVPVDQMECPIRRWKIVLVNRSAKNQPLPLKTANCLGDLDGRELHFQTDHRPASRFLYYHYVMTLLRCRAYRQPGWENALEILKSGYPWPTPGAYLRSTMLLALAEVIGDVDEMYLEELARKNTFQQPTKLAADEEAEIARRIVEYFDEGREIERKIGGEEVVEEWEMGEKGDGNDKEKGHENEGGDDKKENDENKGGDDDEDDEKESKESPHGNGGH